MFVFRYTMNFAEFAQTSMASYIPTYLFPSPSTVLGFLRNLLGELGKERVPVEVAIGMFGDTDIGSRIRHTHIHKPHITINATEVEYLVGVHGYIGVRSARMEELLLRALNGEVHRRGIPYLGNNEGVLSFRVQAEVTDDHVRWYTTSPVNDSRIGYCVPKLVCYDDPLNTETIMLYRYEARERAIPESAWVMLDASATTLTDKHSSNTAQQLEFTYV